MARAMKDSGIEWIGKIPEDWEVYPARYAFSEVKKKNTDGDITKALKFFNGTIIPKINFDADEDDYVADTILSYTVVVPNTIMINGLNLNYDLKSLRVGLVKEEGVITSAYLALSPNEYRINPQFATYLFKGYETKMAFHNMGAGIRKTLGFKEFKRQPILLPKIDEQQKIANFLDTKCASIDAIIEKTKASIEEYKKLKQAIITQAVTKGIRPKRKMKESGIGWTEKIPEDWNTTKIGRIGKTSSGATPLRSKEMDYFEEATIRWIRTMDLNDGIVIDSSEKITELALQNASCNVMPVDTVCVAMYGGAGTIGKCAILKKECSTNQAVCSIVCEKKVMNSMYLLYQLLALKKYWMLFAVGTRKDPNISQEIVGKMNIICPPIEEQMEIVEYLDNKLVEINRLIDTKTVYLNNIEKYKKSLIYEYVTGKKEVPV